MVVSSHVEIQRAKSNSLTTSQVQFYPWDYKILQISRTWPSMILIIKENEQCPEVQKSWPSPVPLQKRRRKKKKQMGRKEKQERKKYREISFASGGFQSIRQVFHLGNLPSFDNLLVCIFLFWIRNPKCQSDTNSTMGNLIRVVSYINSFSRIEFLQCIYLIMLFL